MTTRTFQNTDAYNRAWGELTDPRTGTTLGLAPGEVVELDLPDDFEDHYLKPLELQQPAPRASQPAPKPSQSQPTTEQATPAEGSPPAVPTSDDQKEA